MKKLFVVVSVALLGSVVVALAANPRFVMATDELVGENLVVSFREVGLGQASSIDYVVTAGNIATYACVSVGNECGNPVSVNEPVAAASTMVPRRGGQVSGSLSLSPHSLELECALGDTKHLIDVTYYNITITDVTNGITQAVIPSAVEATLFVCS